MLYAGYLVSTGDATLLQVVAAGAVGNLIGSWVAWGVGAYGGRTFIERWGKWVHLSHKHLDWADRWFERWGNRTVFFTRVLPIIRTFISLPAGIARMPLGRFTIYTLAGCIPWVAALALIGVRMGDRWEEARDVLHYGDYIVVVACAVAIAWLALRHMSARRAAT
jgi:membrane protein DedA with SNARE-associated domain